MKERWIWIVGLVIAVVLTMAADGSVASKAVGLAILALAVIACEFITRWSIEKAAKIRQQGAPS